MVHKKNAVRAIAVEPPASKPSLPLLLAFVAIGLLVVLVAVGLLRGAARPADKKVNSLDIATLIERVGGHIMIAQNEMPTIATVQDPDALREKDPDFYRYAQAGDRLLVWSDKAVLYSERKDRLLAVFPVASRSGSASTSIFEDNLSTGTSTEEILLKSAKIEIRNGTRITGLARNLSTKLKALGYNVLSTRDAVRKNYTNTLVVTVKDEKFNPIAAKIVEFVGGQVVSLPVVETGVRGDVLVILGTDYSQ